MDKNYRYKIAILIPSYNDLINLKKFVNKINKKYYILVIDDNSKDQTSSFLKKNKINYLKNSRNLGYENSLIKGIKFLIKKNFDYVVTFDADGEHKITDLKKIFNKKIYLNSDIIICNRDRQNRLLEKIISVIFEIKFHLKDPLSGFKIYNLKKFKDFNFSKIKKLFLVDIIMKSKKLLTISNFSISTNKRIDISRVGNYIEVNCKLLKIFFKIIFY
jgi:cellulose synthase/poly-beta-1,6-N-acetylglucosamine synthase-like glycosyltransferase